MCGGRGTICRIHRRHSDRKQKSLITYKTEQNLKCRRASMPEKAKSTGVKE